MAVQKINGHTDHSSTGVPFIDLQFDVRNSESSALELVYQIRPEWRDHSEQLKITKFTDGITNTLLRVSRHRPGAPSTEADDDAVLMRAYGNGTDLIIDRNREAISHGLLAERHLAPPLLGRFRNGLLYGFIPGKVCKAPDLAQEPVWRGVAQKLGEWHAKVPCSGISTYSPAANAMNGHTNGTTNGHGIANSKEKVTTIASRRPTPNLWSVMQNWINALSIDTDKEKARQKMLQQEMERSFQELDSQDGIGEHGFVFAHCDLLCANVIQIESPDAPATTHFQPVTFIDYEYATPAPAVFDIANHFAEWAGYDCDYSMVPGPFVRKRFLQEYLASYSKHTNDELDPSTVDQLFQDTNRWRGIPGLYWGIWALIQAKISEIDFDYSTYAEQRLGEYFAWRGEADGSRLRQDRQMPLRERTWAGE